MVKSKSKKKEQKEDLVDFKIGEFSLLEKISSKKIGSCLEGEGERREKIVGIDQLKKILTNRAQNLNAFNLIESPTQQKKKMQRLNKNNLSCIKR